MAAAVERLSRGFTRERELAGARYLDDERLLGAYLLFYWPVSYLQARGVLSELPRRPRTCTVPIALTIPQETKSRWPHG